jgi:hypothetical protein
MPRTKKSTKSTKSRSRSRSRSVKKVLKTKTKKVSKSKSKSRSSSKSKTKAPVYKYSYFPVFGRGEWGRVALEMAGVKWIDNPITNEVWREGSFKKSTPNGCMPVL